MKNRSLTFCLGIAVLFGSVESGFALPKCPSDPSAHWHNCIGIYTDEIGKYAGEWQNNKRKGQATLTYPNGDKYVGEFKDDKRSGQGTYSHAGGTVKEGIWKDGEFQYAKKLSPPVPIAKTPTQDDEIISASSGSGFASDLPPCPEYRHPTESPWINCFGTFTWSGGDKYFGEFKDDEQHGQGTYTYANGDKYVGEWSDNEKNGQGTYTWADGKREIGEYKNGKLNGYAIQYRADGSVAREGIFKDDKFLYASKNPNKSSSSNNSSKVEKSKSTCTEIGFTPGTQDFGKCVLKMMDIE